MEDVKCCINCEHCEAVERNDDFILCCFVRGDEKGVKTSQHHICKDYEESVLADILIFDSEPNEEKPNENPSQKPKLKPIPEFLKACEGRGDDKRHHRSLFGGALWP